MDDPVSEPVGLPWEGQDTPARRATLTRILVRIAREALQGADLDSLLQGICECLVAELPVAIASVILLDEANQSFVHEVYDGEWTQSPLAVAGDWPVTRGAAGRCARLGTAQLITDVDADPDYVAGNVHVRSEYLVPIPITRSASSRPTRRSKACGMTQRTRPTTRRRSNSTSASSSLPSPGPSARRTASRCTLCRQQ